MFYIYEKLVNCKEKTKSKQYMIMNKDQNHASSHLLYYLLLPVLCQRLRGQDVPHNEAKLHEPGCTVDLILGLTGQHEAVSHLGNSLPGSDRPGSSPGPYVGRKRHSFGQDQLGKNQHITREDQLWSSKTIYDDDTPILHELIETRKKFQRVT